MKMLSNISDFNWFINCQYLAAIMFHFANKMCPTSDANNSGLSNDMFDEEIFSKSLCTSAFVFSSSTASVHLFHQASIPWSFLSLPWFWAWFAGVSRMWNKASSIECYVVEHWNTVFMSEVPEFILWMGLQGSVLTRLCDKILLWKKLSGGGERSSNFRKILKTSLFAVFAMGAWNFILLLQCWKA